VFFRLAHWESALLTLLVIGCDVNLELKTEASRSSSYTIDSVEPQEIVAGESVTLKGEGFKYGMIVKLGDMEIVPTVVGRREAFFIAPEISVPQVEILRNGFTHQSEGEESNLASEDEAFVLKIKSFEYPTFNGNTDEICEGQQYIGRSGEIETGTKKCGSKSCTADGEIDCLTTEVYPAVETAQIDESMVKLGITIAGVEGKYPSADYPLAGADTTDNLTSDNFNAKLQSAAMFEFFDEAGNRYVTSGDVDLVAANIPSGISLFGIAGSANVEIHSDCNADGVVGCVTTAAYRSADAADTLATNIKVGVTIAGVAGSVTQESHSDCSSDAEIGCVTVGAFRAVDMNYVSAGTIKDGIVIAGITGDYPSATYPLTGASGTADLTDSTFDTKIKSATAFEYFDSAGMRYTGAGDADLSAANIKDGIEIFDVTGTSKLESHIDCSQDAEIGCIAVATFKAVDMSNVNAGTLRSGVTIAGVTGDYPSATYPLSGADATDDLTSGTFEAQIKSSAAFEYFDSSGTRYTGSGDVDLAATNVVDSVQIFDIVGTSELESHNDCSVDAEVGCVTVPSFMAVDMSNVTAGTLKSGVTIAGVTGDYPSATYPLPGADATADLTSATFDAQVKSATAFEYFDSAGVRHTGAGDADLAPSNVVDDIQIFDITGTAVVESHSDCSTDAEISCITVAGFKAVDMTNVAAGTIKSGVTIAGVTGDYPSANYPLAGADGTADLTEAVFGAKMESATAFEYFDSTGARHTGTGDADLASINVVDGTQIFEITGTAEVETHSDCTSDAQMGCVTVAAFKAVDMSNVTEGNIKSGVVVAGITGDYPSATYPLTDSSALIADLDNASYEAKLKSATQFEFFDSAGTRHLNAGDSDLVAGNIKENEVVFDVTGTADIESHSDCSADAEIGCITVETFKAADMSNVTAGTIKDGVVVAGVTGDYPSATFPLNGAGGTADLTSATFEVQVKSAAAFEYFDSTGARQTGAGDADLAAANLKLNISVFGETGTYNGITPDPLNIRIGTTINGIAGQMKVNCRNPIVNAKFNYDGLTSAIPNTTVTTGTVPDWWDTITDYHGGGTFPPANLPNGANPENQWSINTYCDENNFVVNAEDGACDSAADECTITDKISGLMYSEQGASTVSWPAAVAHCDNLVHANLSDWRLPTQKEIMATSIRGIRAINKLGLSLTAFDSDMWSATTAESGDGSQAFRTDFSETNSRSKPKTDLYGVICVREI
jgi:hypothetical protein